MGSLITSMPSIGILSFTPPSTVVSKIGMGAFFRSNSRVRPPNIIGIRSGLMYLNLTDRNDTF